MYEAKQNKEKVSRRIEVADLKRNMKFKNNSKFVTNLNSTIQFATALLYEDIRGISPEARINGIAHSRVDMTTWQKNNALRPTGYQIPPRATCNHCVSYKMVRDAVNNMLTDVSLIAGLENLGIAGEAYENYYEASRDAFEEEGINCLIDDFIDEKANNPRNLFYWPNHLGDSNGNLIDYPCETGDDIFDAAHEKELIEAQVSLQDYANNLCNLLHI